MTGRPKIQQTQGDARYMIRHQVADRNVNVAVNNIELKVFKEKRNAEDKNTKFAQNDNRMDIMMKTYLDSLIAKNSVDSNDVVVKKDVENIVKVLKY